MQNVVHHSTLTPQRRTLTGHAIHHSTLTPPRRTLTGHVVHDFTLSGSSQLNIGDHYHYNFHTIINKESDNLHDWISPIKYWVHHQSAIADLHASSGEWLLNKKEFESWESSTQTSILWLHGIPGSGKTKLVSKVIENLKPKFPKSAGTFAYFYCLRDAAEDERSRPRELIRSILRQLGFTGTDPKVLKPFLASLHSAKEEEAKAHGSEVVEALTWNECVDALIAILQGSNTVIVIDAIDELKEEERFEFYKTLSRIRNDVDQGVVRVFLSSRDDQDIVRTLKKHANLYISAADNQCDVDRFVKTEVEEAISFQRLLSGKRISDSLREEIISTLSRGAQGMFRWVSLQIQTLFSPRVRTISQLKRILGKLPKTLEASYDAIYLEMVEDKISGRIALNAVRWLLCAKRQLQSSELIAAAFLTNRDETGTTDEEIDQYDEDDILLFCSNLVILDRSLGVFRLAHLSVREYFEKKEGYEQSFIQNMAFGTCLNILTSKSTSDSQALADFGSYAIFFWPFHCSEFGSKGPAGDYRDNLLDILLRGCAGSQFFESFEKWASGVRSLLLARDDYYSKQLQKEGIQKLLAATTGPCHPVFLASTFGFDWMLEVFFSDPGFDPGRKNELEDSGISLGATFGHLSVVQAFLDRGIDVDFKGESLRTPLNRAVVYKHTELAKFLIAKGADVNLCAASTPGVNGYSPLHEAAWGGHSQIIPLLLEKGADINARSRQTWTPLMMAAQNGFIDVVRILLQHGADATLRDKDGRTAIQLGLFDYSNQISVRYGHYGNIALRADRADLIKFLLDQGFELNIVEDGQSVFDYALTQGLRQTLEVLVKEEAHPHSRGWSAESPKVTAWKDESWFPELLEIISNHNSSVLSLPSSGIPFTVRASKEQEFSVIENSPQVPYVSLQIPNDTVLVTKVTFTTESHDQGFSGTAAVDRGTYNNTWTYFEVEASTSTGETTPRKRFQSNVHASSEWKTHVVCWDINDIAADQEGKDWVAALKPGDIVKVIPRAVFPAWRNFVRRVVIEIEGLRKPSLSLETLALDTPSVQEEETGCE